MSASLIYGQRSGQRRPLGPTAYAPLICAIAVYRTGAEKIATRLKAIAEELTFQIDVDTLQKKRIGSGVCAGGSAVAVGAGIVGLITTGPLIPVALLLGGATTASGLVVKYLAGREGERRQKSLLTEVSRMFADLETKVKAIAKEIQNLVGGCDDNAKELDYLLDQLGEDMSAASLRDLPRLRDLMEILRSLQQIYREMPEDIAAQAKNFLFNAWHSVAPLAGVGLSQLVGDTSATAQCQHAWLSACDKGKPQHFSCYTLAGKVVYAAGLAANGASFIWSAIDVAFITQELNRVRSTAAKDSEKERIYAGLAAHLHGKACDLQTRLQILFSKEYDVNKERY